MSSRPKFVFSAVLLTGCFAAQPASNEDTEGGNGSSSTLTGSTSTIGTSTGTTDTPTSTTTDTPTSATTGSTSTNATGTGSSSTTDNPTTGDSSSSSSDTGSPSSSTSIEEACEAGNDCIPLTPEGWNGPAVIAVGDVDALPECPDSFPELQPSAFANPDFAPAECGCTCEVTEELMCDIIGPVPGASYFASPTCEGIGTSVGVLGGCNSVVTGPNGSVNFQIQGGTFGDGCSTETTESLPDGQWSTGVRVCGAEPEPVGCDDGSECAPTTPEGFDARCIWSEGDVACPEGQSQFINRQTYFTEQDDTRACAGNCGCSTGIACGSGDVELYANDNCTGLIESVEIGSGCEAVDAAVQSARWVGTGDTTTCNPGGGYGPVGEVLEAGPVTFCCE